MNIKQYVGVIALIAAIGFNFSQALRIGDLKRDLSDSQFELSQANVAIKTAQVQADQQTKRLQKAQVQADQLQKVETEHLKVLTAARIPSDCIAAVHYGLTHINSIGTI